LIHLVRLMTIIERFACRAVLLTPDNYVLLLKLRNPDTAAEFWINPGGGIEPNEDHMSGLKRELFEEIGVTNLLGLPCCGQKTLYYGKLMWCHNRSD
jgi:8-oxo-dGTP pyrophosphatase MutT (NUDIX family)